MFICFIFIFRFFIYLFIYLSVSRWSYKVFIEVFELFPPVQISRPFYLWLFFSSFSLCLFYYLSLCHTKPVCAAQNILLLLAYCRKRNLHMHQQRHSYTMCHLVRRSVLDEFRFACIVLPYFNLAKVDLTPVSRLGLTTANLSATP